MVMRYREPRRKATAVVAGGRQPRKKAKPKQFKNDLSKKAARRARPASALQTGPEGRPQPVGPTSQKKIRNAVVAGMGSRRVPKRRPAMGVGPEGRRQPIGPGQPRQKTGPRAIRKPEESYRGKRRKQSSY
jgi:hypothetical protein